MSETLRVIMAMQYAEANKKFETFTKAKELLTKVESEFGEEYATGLYKCFMMGLCAFPNLTEDELIEKVLNDIKKG